MHIFKQYPTGFTSLFFTQILFNFGFYGFKSLFLLYTIDLFGLKEQEAIAFFSAFMSLTYATSLVGGALADKVIGARNSLLIGGILCCVSIFVLSLSPHLTVYGAMATLSVGLGCFKPNFSTMLSMLFKNSQDPRKDNAFTTHYVAMNIGNFMGPIACSLMSRTYGWHYGLMLVVLSFLSGVLLFYKQGHAFKDHLRKNSFFALGKALILLVLIACIIFFLFRHQLYFHGLMGVIMAASLMSFSVVFYQSNSQERQGLLKAISYIFLFTIFCALYEQCGSSLILFFDRFVDRQVFNYTLPASNLLSLNPILVLILGIIIPIVSKRILNNKATLEGFTKFSIGFFLTSLSFGVLSLAASRNYIPISILWMFAAMTLQTLGELFVVPVGFSNISKLAPQRHIGFMMGLWLMAISYGHYLAGLLANTSLNTEKGTFINTLENFSHFFIKLSILPFIIAVLLLIFMVLTRSRKTI